VSVFRSKLALRPNCFLTRRPLLFIPPPRTLLNYRAPWGNLIEYLQQHGYEARLMDWPFQSSQLQKTVLRQINPSRLHHHIFVDGETFALFKAEFKDLLQQSPCTLTVIGPSRPAIEAKDLFFLESPQLISPRWTYRAHQAWLTWKHDRPTLPDHAYVNQLTDESLNRLLLHSTRLAELDFELD
jgi:hypothetical protein